MNLELRVEGVPMNDRLHSFIDRKMRYALGRFGHRVRNVRVRIKDVNGPKNGRDIQCSIQASLSPSGVVTIDELREDPFSAVAKASERVSQRMSRHIERLNARRQGRIRQG